VPGLWDLSAPGVSACHFWGTELVVRRDEATMVTSRDPWCPGGVGPRCPCPGAGLAYPMRSHVPPNASFVGTSNFACYAPSDSARCTPTGFAAATGIDGTISNGSTCLPDADIKWTPEAWESEDIVPRLPRNVSVRQLQRACDGIIVNVARPEWVPLLRKLFHSKYGPHSWSLHNAAGDRIDEPTKLASVAVVRINVTVNATERRMRKARCLERCAHGGQACTLERHMCCHAPCVDMQSYVHAQLHVGSTPCMWHSRHVASTPCMWHSRHHTPH
jgi:hypothetical protein